MVDAPKKLMRKPRICDAAGCDAPFPSLGIGCPATWSDQPVHLRGVYLWHCGAPACAADCAARFAVQLRKAGRHDLAAKLEPSKPRAPASPPPPRPRADLAQPSLL